MQESWIYIRTSGARFRAVERTKRTILNAKSPIARFLVWQFHWNRRERMTAPVTEHIGFGGPRGIGYTIGQRDDFVRHPQILTIL